jgi:HAD superfamily hydrolase (TIGR01548 family)
VTPPAPPAPEAILFDMDGVLADVSGSYRRAILLTVASYGVSASAEDVARIKAQGNANNDWVVTRRLLAALGVDAPLDEVTARFEAHYEGTPDAPGLYRSERLLASMALLRELRARVPLGVVTGRPRRQAERFLAQHGISSLFDVLVAMEDAPLKPDPAPVRMALGRLGVGGGWMIGDTPDDIRAALAAGAVGVGIAAPGEDPEVAAGVLRGAGAVAIARRLEEILEWMP